MNWLKRLMCKHPTLQVHGYTKYLPDNTHVLSQCIVCGRNKQYNLGKVPRGARTDAMVFKLRARGYEPVLDDNPYIRFRRTAA